MSPGDWHQRARVATGIDPRPKTVPALADRIEADIRDRVEKRIDEALAVARDVAFRAYANALRAPCGIPFDVVVAQVMSEAERSLREQAVVAGERAETEIVLQRLQAA